MLENFEKELRLLLDTFEQELNQTTELSIAEVKNAALLGRVRAYLRKQNTPPTLTPDEIVPTGNEADAFKRKLKSRAVAWLQKQIMKQPWHADLRQAIFKDVTRMLAEFANGWDIRHFEE